ncbi:GNAT family N-acetyltransferase [Mariniflexile sp. HMF6888]|uniref:GNAT family N-acetyltransferase n=1 Tax=Mariniflexile sp. HMF6888 TaxID=3373086 RepID=UPI0037A860B4
MTEKHTSFKIVKYTSAYYNEWNGFIENSKNGTFLFHRDFMEYHKDRFEDFSLLVFKEDKLLAVLPANKLEQEIHSHQGLTYGGLILPKMVKFDTVIAVFAQLLKYLKGYGFETLVLKQIPSIYSKVFTEEIEFLMFILKAELIRKDTLSVIDLNNKLKISNNRLEGYKRGVKHNLIVKEEAGFELFWNNILVKNLQNRHKANPVHTLQEITLLKKHFPNNIRQFNVYNQDEIVAGTTIFESRFVVHSQYISGNADKNTLGSLDFLHYHLITEVFKDKKYFDFGTSNENNGLHINEGLQFWKEGFGARMLTQNFYRVPINNYQLLNNVFI